VEGPFGPRTAGNRRTAGLRGFSIPSRAEWIQLHAPAQQRPAGEKIMGLAMGIPQLLIILVIVALIFGTKRLKEVGGELGGALKSFRRAMSTGDSEEATPEPKRLARDEQEKQ
jgi:sec-independent protein translocase protein TatA